MIIVVDVTLEDILEIDKADDNGLELRLLRIAFNIELIVIF